MKEIKKYETLFIKINLFSLSEVLYVSGPLGEDEIPNLPIGRD